MIHANSPWRTGPWVKVNCPAIPGTLLESELFGYEKGAFTGAYGTKPGRVEMAHRGTLFLDEISELDLGLQSKLLQLLQDGQFCRIGAQEDKKVEVRVVCATNRKLEQEIESGTFRADLFYRINVVNLHMPALRERASDIPDLVDYFLAYYNRKYNSRAMPISDELMARLGKYHWPGNVRELENLIKRYVILGDEEVISSDLAPRETDFFNAEIPIDGQISLKKLTRRQYVNSSAKLFSRCCRPIIGTVSSQRALLASATGRCSTRYVMPVCLLTGPSAEARQRVLRIAASRPTDLTFASASILKTSSQTILPAID
jgi:transcriptional regulator with PAS, ATPase and Fis domain